MPPEALDREEIRARAFWSGTISFGLVSIPVSLFPATRSQRVSLRMLDPEGTPLARRYFDAESDRQIAPDHIVRGFELEEGDFVPVTDAELDAVAPEKSRDIDLRRFVEVGAIDPLLYERAYYLTPAGESTKAYRLLAEAMQETSRAGIATFVMRGKEYLVAILAERGILRAETLRFAEEIRTPEDVGLPDPVAPDRTRVRTIERAVEKLTARTFDPAELPDEETERLRALIEKKRRRNEDVVVAAAADAQDGDATPVIDLMELLKRSMQGSGKRRGPRPATQAAAGDDLESRSRDELYERAKRLDIPGRSSMSKRQLISALRKSA